MVCDTALVPLSTLAAAAQIWQPGSDDHLGAGIVVRLSVQDDLLCLTDIIRVTTTTIVLLTGVQIGGQLVAKAELLVPREQDRKDLPNKGGVPSKKGEGGVEGVGLVRTVVHLGALAESEDKKTIFLHHIRGKVEAYDLLDYGLVPN